jgi:hypothetical protein
MITCSKKKYLKMQDLTYVKGSLMVFEPHFSDRRAMFQRLQTSMAIVHKIHNPFFVSLLIVNDFQERQI